MKMKKIAGLVLGIGAMLSLVLVASSSPAQETKKEGGEGNDGRYQERG